MNNHEQKTHKKGTKTMAMKKKNRKPACPKVFTIKFARKLVRYLGGDASKIDENDCWESLGNKFPNLIPKAMKYFEKARTGDTSWAAYYLVRDCKVNVKWAMGIIEKPKQENPLGRHIVL